MSTTSLDFWNDKHLSYATKDFVHMPNYFAREVAQNLQPGSAVLDLGCGQGQDSLYLAHQLMTVTACDFSQDALDMFAAEAQRAGVAVSRVDLSELPLPFPDAAFDAVYAHLVLHYFDRAATVQLFDEVARILRPGGSLYALFNSDRDPEATQGREIEPRYREIAPGNLKRFFTPGELGDLLGHQFEKPDASYGRGTTKNAEDEWVKLEVRRGKAGAPQGWSGVIAFLGEERATDKAVFGGKGGTLGQLYRAGFPVPPGFVLSAGAYLDHLATLDLPARLDGEPFAQWARMVESEILAQPVPATAASAAANGTRHFPPGTPLIVRSSAVGEDSASDSFAGQLESISDVQATDLSQAIRQVWASAWSPRAAAYRERRGLTGLDDVPVAVLVQRFVEPDWAGVLFTRAPTPGDSGPVVEAVRGRGEELVSGRVDPYRFWLGSTGDVLRTDHDGVTALDTSIPELHAVGSRLEGLFGSPQDVEWAISAGVLWIVQSRPITAGLSASGTANVDSFRGAVRQVTAAHQSLIPADLAGKDKFKLRLIATATGAEISRGWLVSISNEPGPESKALGDIASTVTAEVERFPQVSMVLQKPARLDGEIVRQFTPVPDLEANLRMLVGQLGARMPEFDLIITEIYEAEKSGISHLAGGRLVVEVAYGSYVPKGVVPTSIYVTDETGQFDLKQSPLQESGIFIIDGKAVERAVGKRAELTSKQLNQIWQLTKAVASAYADVSVEFGVLEEGTPYLIDIIPDMSPIGVDDIRVMSPGRLTGAARVAESEELATKSLEAHFHSERGGEGTPAGRGCTIVVAPRPFLALEDYLSQFGPGSVAFVFEQGSLLGHLAIILREHGVPAIVVPEIRSLVRDGDIITIDTAADDLLHVEAKDGSLAQPR